jgi:hypothetical protein
LLCQCSEQVIRLEQLYHILSAGTAYIDWFPDLAVGPNTGPDKGVSSRRLSMNDDILLIGVMKYSLYLLGQWGSTISWLDLGFRD